MDPNIRPNTETDRSTRPRPAGYSTAAAHRRLKDLAIDGDGAAVELARHLDGTITALQSVLTSTPD